MACNCEGNTYHISMGCCTPVVANANHYYTKSEVDKMLSASTSASCCITEDEVDEKISTAVGSIDLSDYALKGDIPTVPTNVSAFNNDVPYLTSHQSLEGLISENDLTAYTYSKDEIDLKIGNGGGSETDLSDYYTKVSCFADKALEICVLPLVSALVSGTNIKTINGNSLLGNGDITIEGGSGGAYTAGRGITISGSEISFNLPISASTYGSGIQEGAFTEAKGYASHAEGGMSKANGSYSHAEGNSTSAMSESSHAEGKNTFASGDSSHAEGNRTYATSQASHAEGDSTSATSYYAHAEGGNTLAKGFASHAEGYGTVTNASYEHASGIFNTSIWNYSSTFGDSGSTLFTIGNGEGKSKSHNAFEVRQNGDVYISDTESTSTSNYYEKPLRRLQDIPLFWHGTKSEFDALGTKDNRTIYLVYDGGQ